EPTNLRRAATALALSDQVLAALVSEGDEGRDLDGDGDQSDTVAAVHPVGDGTWTDLGRAADALGVEGEMVTLLTPQDDGTHVLQVYDAAAGRFLVGVGAPIAAPPAVRRRVARAATATAPRAISPCRPWTGGRSRRRPSRARLRPPEHAFSRQRPPVYARTRHGRA